MIEEVEEWIETNKDYVPTLKLSTAANTMPPVKKIAISSEFKEDELSELKSETNTSTVQPATIVIDDSVTYANVPDQGDSMCQLQESALINDVSNNETNI